MSSSYNPAEETINSILTGLLPVLIVGLFNGFEDAILGIISYIRFLRVQYINEVKENENNKNVSLDEEETEIDERGNDETSINMDDENVNNTNEENDEKINGRVIYKIIKKLFKKSTVLLIVYPAIVSGYLISTDPITTKIAFGICTLAFTRLVDHFNEKPDKINTLISIYLNGEENSKDKEQIDKLTEEIEKLTKKINIQTNVINNLRKEIKENKLNRAET
ncbi:hypothetical protein RhiirA4_521907 [Rhizophagus irregularis]|uniref:Uncharacterized protein n=1 Tax=Rhizophagus irregularis TaxID=588596 RepID=A0A2I1HR47_9GLOM|nr:hypothetical protein RhiirA4_521907 [Rhizophagus irregularis]